MELDPTALSIRLLRGRLSPRRMGARVSDRKRSPVGRIDFHVTADGHLVRASRRLERLSIVLERTDATPPLETLESIPIEEFTEEIVVDRTRWRVFLFGKIFEARSPEDYGKLDEGIAATAGVDSLHHVEDGSGSRTILHTMSRDDAFIVEGYRTFPASQAMVTTHLRLQAR